MKNTRKLIPAIAMLLVSAVMMSTASFAWFTMNSKVEATGISMTAVAPASLWIAQETADSSEPAWLSAIALVNENTDTNGSGYLYLPVTPKADTAMEFETVKDATKVNINGQAPQDAEMVDSNSYYMDDFLLKLDGQTGDKSNVTVKAAVSLPTGNATVDTADKIWDALRVAFVIGGEIKATLDFSTLNAAGASTLTFTDAETLVELEAAATTPTTVTAYAWFEGTDAACINANAFNEQLFNITLVFELANTN